jgi:hypothetical protein
LERVNNPLRRTAAVWGGVIVLGVIIIFIPGIIGLDGFDGGFALSFGGLIVAIFGVIGTIIYIRLASRLDQILKKENQLAHWTYTTEEWKDYTEKEHAEDIGVKKMLFLLIAAIAIIVGIAYYAFVRNGFIAIFSSVLGIIAIVGIAAYFSTLSVYLQNKRRQGEAYISRDGVFLNRQAHIWKGIGARLENAAYQESNLSQPRIKFDYSVPSRMGRNYFSARVPVPTGQEGKAKQVVADILTANNVHHQS